LRDVIGPALSSSLQATTDSAQLPWTGNELAFTTDSYVINPAVFPGGHIGELAVIGTANDLAMVGAEMLFLSCGLIIEEGFSIAELRMILADMQQTAADMGAQIVTGDTKVVERGKGDGLFINTSGVGKLPNPSSRIGPQRIAQGDVIIVSGDIGRHGASVMALRDNCHIEGLRSDLAWLGPKVQALQSAGIDVHCLRDLTRGGLVSALYECAESADLSFTLQAGDIPISDPVSCYCELTGIDPLHLANEGRFVMFCPSNDQARVMDILHQWEDGTKASVIGEVSAPSAHRLVQETIYGTQRILTPPLGDQFPRIC
jgi:hydrogenase expression/formation protein HypE